MDTDVRKYCKACESCQKSNAATHKLSAPLTSIPVPSKKWSIVGMDIIGPMATTRNGNKYIVALTDHFTKFPVARAIPAKTAGEVAKFFRDTICLFGCFESVITDQGREFVNKIFDELTTTFKIDHQISSAYHPQTNGQRERDNRTLKEMLSKCVGNGDPSEWDEYLQGVLFAYRTSVHASTKISPQEALFGETARLPSDVTGTASAEEVTEQTMDIMRRSAAGIKKAASENIAQAQRKQAANFEKRRTKTEANKIKVGSQVLLRNAVRINRQGSKLAPRYTGPYDVIAVLQKGRLRLRNTASGKVLKNLYNITNVKIFHTEQEGEGKMGRSRKDSQDLSEACSSQMSSDVDDADADKTEACRPTKGQDKRSPTQETSPSQDTSDTSVSQPLTDDNDDNEADDDESGTFGPAMEQNREPPKPETPDKNVEASMDDAKGATKEYQLKTCRVTLRRCDKDDGVEVTKVVRGDEMFFFFPVNDKWRTERQGAFKDVAPESMPTPMGKASVDSPRKVKVTTPPASRVSIKGDGNCLFRAFSHIIFGDEANHMLVRKSICDYLEEFALAFYGVSGNFTHVKTRKMRAKRVWGTDVEIIAMATMLNTPVYIYSQISRSKQAWLKYSPVHSIPPRYSLSRRSIFLCNLHHHFEPVLSLVE